MSERQSSGKSSSGGATWLIVACIAGVLMLGMCCIGSVVMGWFVLTTSEAVIERSPMVQADKMLNEMMGELGAMESIAEMERLPVQFTGGHETVAVDRGRPVVLIAGAIGVEPEAFRQAFSGVSPAPAGTAPTRERERANKDVLMQALGPRGVTNDRLDEVSNYYRYNPGRGDMWPTDDAKAWAIVAQGKIVDFVIEDGGSGYSSPPTIVIPGYEGFAAEVELAYGPEFSTNGSVDAIQAIDASHEDSN